MDEKIPYNEFTRLTENLFRDEDEQRDPVAKAYDIVYNELKKFDNDPANHIIGCDVLEEVLGYLGEALS